MTAAETVGAAQKMEPGDSAIVCARVPDGPLRGVFRFLGGDGPVIILASPSDVIHYVPAECFAFIGRLATPWGELKTDLAKRGW